MIVDDATGDVLGWGSAAFVNRRIGPPLDAVPTVWGVPLPPASSGEALLGTSSPRAGVVDLPIEAPVTNSGDALATVMGGIQAVLAELAAAQVVPAGHEVSGLAIRYLSRVKNGPLRAVAERLPYVGAPCNIRVTLVDTGDGDRLVAHVIADARPVSPP